MRKPLVGLLITALVIVVGWLIWCTQQPCGHKIKGFNTLRWPPDTIMMVHLKGNIYSVTSVPAEEDPTMNLYIWPPDTNIQYPEKMILVWPPDTTM